MHLKMAEALGTVHTGGRGLLQSYCFDQMAAPVPEIMDGLLYVWRFM
jgi:hypothetical protein